MDETPRAKAETDATIQVEIIQAIIAVQMSNFEDMEFSPDGPFPACKNRLGTYICERCGRDVREARDVCPAIPIEKRWRFRLSRSVDSNTADLNPK